METDKHDVDRNGFIDEEEFKRTKISQLKHELGLEEDAKLSEDELKWCEKVARKEFRLFDWNKNGLLDPKEFRAFFKHALERQMADDTVDVLFP